MECGGGDVTGLGARDAVMIDNTYLQELGVKKLGDTAEVGASRVRVSGLTEGIRSFTVTPYVFSTIKPGQDADRHASRQDHVRARQTAAGSRRGERAHRHPGQGTRQRSADDGRISHAQSEPLAVRDRRRGSP